MLGWVIGDSTRPNICLGGHFAALHGFASQGCDAPLHLTLLSLEILDWIS